MSILFRGLRQRIKSNLGIERRLVRVINAGEVLDFAPPSVIHSNLQLAEICPATRIIRPGPNGCLIAPLSDPVLLT